VGYNFSTDIIVATGSWVLERVDADYPHVAGCNFIGSLGF
jgi:hypothetical protein